MTLEQKLVAVIDQVVAIVAAGAEQWPDVASQFLTFSLIQAGMWSVVYVAAAVMGWRLTLFLYRKAKACGDPFDLEDELLWIAAGSVGAATCAVSAAGVFQILTVLKIIVAPKLFILENLATLVGR